MPAHRNPWVTSMQIANGSVVSLHYRVATAEGEHVDASEPGQPMWYLHGQGNIIPGLEAALLGKSAGQHVSCEVTPEQGYGTRDPDLDLAVPRSAFPADVHAQLKPGFRFMAEHPKIDGEQAEFVVHGSRGG